MSLQKVTKGGRESKSSRGGLVGRALVAVRGQVLATKIVSHAQPLQAQATMYVCCVCVWMLSLNLGWVGGGATKIMLCGVAACG